jgi:hypothetical protein
MLFVDFRRRMCRPYGTMWGNMALSIFAHTEDRGVALKLCNLSTQQVQTLCVIVFSEFQLRISFIEGKICFSCLQ